MADFEPVLLREHRQARQPHAGGLSGRGGYAASARCWPRCRRPRSSNWSRQSGLRGRGGAGFPSGLKWTLPAQGPSRPDLPVRQRRRERAGTFNNRILMEEDPHQVLEGIILGCYATRADDGLHLPALRIRPRSYRRLQQAIDECYAAGLLGKNILGKRVFARHLPASRRGGVHLRRRDRPDRKPGRQAGLAADQAAVSRPSKGPSASRRSSTTSRRWPA